MTGPSALVKGVRGAMAWSLTLLLAGCAIGLVELPYQWLSELGFQLQGLWSAGGLAARPWLLLPLLLGSALFLVLAWGPLAPGRGGGITGVLVLQGVDGEAVQSRATASLSLGGQLARLPLVALTHLAGLSVGTESPSAALGASTLLALRHRFAVLQQLPVSLVAAIGGGAGLGAAFRSPLLGAAYGLEELSAVHGFPLMVPTLILGGIGSLLNSRLGQPARLAEGMGAELELRLLPLALLISVVTALAGVLLVRLLVPLAAWVSQDLRGRRRWITGVGIVLAITLLAVLSGGVSLNDGSLALGPALAGAPATAWWAALPRLLAPLLSIAIGAPGGLMHDSMTLGAVLVTPWLGALPEQQQAALAGVAAAALFSGACRTPLFCALFVFTLQGNAALLPWLLTASAIAAAMGRWLGGPSWNEAQVEAFRSR
ncbi:MAG: chloride channel protein [Cyanobium sp. CZS 48M]|nr:chloride channel protein [Cyanobium sp. CZS48M]